MEDNLISFHILTSNLGAGLGSSRGSKSLGTPRGSKFMVKNAGINRLRRSQVIIRSNFGDSVIIRSLYTGRRLKKPNTAANRVNISLKKKKLSEQFFGDNVTVFFNFKPNVTQASF